ncbi:MAG: hypothetical protein LBB56_03815 [Chitinispirillales bacterium]|jgi:hypothetical protein|nr:hypothetical protein [Chitinispirillales bacterium]
MYNDESNRSNQSPLTRRPITSNKTRSYQQNQSSPSSTYGGGYSSQQQNGGMRRNISSSLTTNNRSRHFNPLDRVVKQNDIIIKLLTEIRDRLPPPPQSAQTGAAAEHTANGSLNNALNDESVFEVSDDLGNAVEEIAEVNFEAQEQQEEDNFNS